MEQSSFSTANEIRAKNPSQAEAAYRIVSLSTEISASKWELRVPSRHPRLGSRAGCRLAAEAQAISAPAATTLAGRRQPRMI